MADGVHIYTVYTTSKFIWTSSIKCTNLRFKEGLPLGIQFNSALNEDRTLLQLGALFENNHKINQPHVEEPDKDKEPDASGEPDKDKEPDASGEPEKDKEPDASGEPEKDKDSDASGKPDKDKETKTSEGPIEGKNQNQNPDKSGKTTSESSLDNSLNSSANQGTKSTESTHAFSDKNMIGKKNSFPKSITKSEVQKYLVLSGLF